jgi:hypothetical protein
MPGALFGDSGAGHGRAGHFRHPNSAIEQHYPEGHP